ncbi:hypothetical protein [Streptomyces sp. NPDC018947]|uniref:hypothetical protein n=1 Tax=Streptomyces sp. NPDC018947 TaxID=3365054 RepID=UPI00379239D3
MSVVDGPDTSAAGAAQLTGQVLFDTEDTLEELVEVGPLGTVQDRYRFHDLPRLYARGRPRAEKPGRDRTLVGDHVPPVTKAPRRCTPVVTRQGTEVCPHWK